MDKQKLYIMQNSFGLIKIGISKDPETRANQIRLASGVGVDVLKVMDCEDAYSTEQWLHKEFTDYRMEGEWFRKISVEDIISAHEKHQYDIKWCTKTSVNKEIKGVGTVCSENNIDAFNNLSSRGDVSVDFGNWEILYKKDCTVEDRDCNLIRNSYKVLPL